MKKNSLLMRILMGGAVVVSCILLIFLQNNTNRIENVDTSKSNSWSIANNSLNGAPLKENKNIYSQQDNSKLTSVYVTAFPTEAENGKTFNFSSFDLQTALGKTDSPVLNANVQFGDQNGALNRLKNAGQINATISLHGDASLKSAMKSYKIKLKKGAETLNGLNILNLNKNLNDVSKITNKFCMDLIEPIDNIASFQTNFMLVYIRDGSLPASQQVYKYYGLYTNMEQPNKTYLQLRGLDENGSLYKAENFEFKQTPELKNVNDAGYDKAKFETVLKISQAKDHTKLLTMLNDINDMNQDFNTVFHKYFNEDNYLTWMACNILLGNEDTIDHNFMLYNPHNSLTWYFLPCNYNGDFAFGDYSSEASSPVPLKGIQRMTGVTLHRRYFEQPGNLEKLSAKIKELRKTYFSKQRVNALIDTYRPVLAATMSKAPDVLIGQLPPDKYNSYLDQFDDQIQLNDKNFKESIKYSTPIAVKEPTKNTTGTVDFQWDPSYSFDGSAIHYNISLAKDSKMQDIVFSQKGISETHYGYNQKIPNGTYYLKITATNGQGLEQYSLDCYTGDNKHMPAYGVRQIVIK